MFSAVLTENDVQEAFDLTTSEPVLFHKTLGSVLQPTFSQRFLSLGGNCIAEDQQWYERQTHVMRFLHRVSIEKRYKKSLRLLCLIRQSSVHGDSSNAESIVPTDYQEITRAIVQLEIIRRSLGGGIVVAKDMAQRFVFKNHGSKRN